MIRHRCGAPNRYIELAESKFLPDTTANGDRHAVRARKKIFLPIIELDECGIEALARQEYFFYLEILYNDVNANLSVC